jgi:hypothetical protein
MPNRNTIQVCNTQSKLNLLQYNRKCSEHSFLYPHEQEALGTKFDLNKSLFRELNLFLSLACNTLRNKHVFIFSCVQKYIKDTRRFS